MTWRTSRTLFVFATKIQFNYLFCHSIWLVLRVRCLAGQCLRAGASCAVIFFNFSWITICAIVDGDGGGGSIECQTIVGDGYKLATPSIRMYLCLVYIYIEDCVRRTSYHLRPNALKCVSIHDLCQTIQNDLMCAKCQTNWIENDMKNERTNTMQTALKTAAHIPGATLELYGSIQ